MTKIVLINGKKRSGKDYFAQALKTELEKHNKNVSIMSFADPIKDIVSISLNIPHDRLEMFKNDPTRYKLCTKRADIYESQTDHRAVLQNFGTEAMKKWFGENVWADLLYKNAMKSNVDYVLVPDFRFLCENVDDSYNIKIQNDIIEAECTDTHRSENELNDFPFQTVINNTDKENTYRDISNDVREYAKFLIN